MEPVEVREVRVLDGPNLYFARPAVKISLAVPGFLALDRRYAVELAERCGLRSPDRASRIPRNANGSSCGSRLT